MGFVAFVPGRTTIPPVSASQVSRNLRDLRPPLNVPGIDFSARSRKTRHFKREIAEALGIDINRYADLIRASRNLSRVLRILIKWGWVARAKNDGDMMATSSGIMFTGGPIWKTNTRHIKRLRRTHAAELAGYYG
jgi:hypothetical protein